MIDGGFDHPNPFEPFPTVSLLNPLYIIAEYVFSGLNPAMTFFRGGVFGILIRKF